MQKNPAGFGLQVLLWVGGIGNIVFSLVGFVGVYLIYHWLAYSFRKLWAMQGSIAKTCVGSVMAWRGLVIFVAAPWVGVYLAFEPPSYPKVLFIVITMMYIAVNSYVLWSLLHMYDLAAHSNGLNSLDVSQTWGEMLSENIAGPRQLVESIDLNMKPLESMTALYILAMFAGSIYWFVKLMIHPDWIVGGWAFCASDLLDSGVTNMLEGITYGSLLIFSIVGIAGIWYGNYVDHIDNTLKERCYSDASMIAFNLEDVDEASLGARRATKCLLAYLIYSVVRFGLFLPVTAMALIDKNICSIYTHFITNIGSGLAFTHPYCSGREVIDIVLTIFFCLLDAYMLYGIYCVLQRFQHKANIRDKQYSGTSYGAAGELVKNVVL